MNALERAAAAHRAATQRHDLTRSRLHAAIVLALRAGTPQREIVQITGYSRERLRQIARSG